MKQEEKDWINKTLAPAILPWAKEHQPTMYDDTVAQYKQSLRRFRNYCVRLIEIRWKEDRAWRMTVPASILEHTDISVTFEQQGWSFTVSGKKCTHRTWSFLELAMLMDVDDFYAMALLKYEFDLEVVSVTKTTPEDKEPVEASDSVGDR